MTIATQNLTAFERGQLDFEQGRRVCPFKRQDLIEAWLDGYDAARRMYRQIYA